MASTSDNNSRRQFLRNTVLAGIGAGMLPSITKAAESASVDAACPPTTLDYYGQGPFYTANAPVISNNMLASQAETGTRLILSGIVKTLDCTSVLANTVLDIWHANDAGAYDNSGFNLRGKVTTNAQGFYLFETVLPGKYLNGASYRPRHIHFRITPPGFPAVITQLYFQGDTSIPGDAAASQVSGTYDATHRIIPITLNQQGKYEGTWDIAVDGAGISGTADLHLDKGMIYSASPNPFKDTVHFNYGVFISSKVTVQVYDLQGSLVAVLDEQQVAPAKYTALWTPPPGLPPGVYFAALKINDLPVHYQKIVKE
jgi:protocatechuate 3,4-dioxygenase beta subunit